MAIKTINFESVDDLTLFNYLGGWLRSTVSPFSGTHCLSSNYIGHNQTTYCTMLVDIKSSGGSVAFRYRTDSESGCDFLKFYINNVQQLSASGAAGAWTQSTTYALPIGVHTLKWQYNKDGSVATGTDAVYVDNILIAGLTAPFIFDTTRMVSGTQVANFDTLRFPGVNINYDTTRNTVRVPSLNVTGHASNGPVTINSLTEQAIQTDSGLGIGIPPSFSFSADAHVPLYLYNSTPTAIGAKQSSNEIAIAHSDMSGTNPVLMSYYYKLFPPILGVLVTVVLTSYSKVISTSSTRLGVFVSTVQAYSKKVRGNLIYSMLQTLSVTAAVRPIASVIDKFVQSLRSTTTTISPITSKITLSSLTVRIMAAVTKKLHTIASRNVTTMRTTTSYLNSVHTAATRLGRCHRVVTNFAIKLNTQTVRISEGVRKSITHVRPVSMFVGIKQICVRRLINTVHAVNGYVDTWYPPSRKKLLSISPIIAFLSMSINVKDRRIEVGLMKECQLGNTARFSAVFRNWDGVMTDPVLVSFKILSSQSVIFETVATVGDNRKAAGSYFVDYVPATTGNYIYEWYAEIDGTPAVKRGNFMVKRTLL